MRRGALLRGGQERGDSTPRAPAETGSTLTRTHAGAHKPAQPNNRPPKPPGVVALQAGVALNPSSACWRIAGTGVVLEQEADLRVVKKLKLVGTPFKVGWLCVWGGGGFKTG